MIVQSSSITDKEALLEGKKLSKRFPIRGGVFSTIKGEVRAVDKVDFFVRSGETFGIVGESGCGKTTLARLVLMLVKPSEGRVVFMGKDITEYPQKIMRRTRKNMQMVFQDPISALDPRMTIKNIVGEPLISFGLARGEELTRRVLELLELVGLKKEHLNRFPHEFSGGQRQRIAVARALALNPSLVVLDEPVSALDVSIRAQIMNLLKDLQVKHNLSYLVIAHNLATVRYMSHSVAIMYLGQIVEYGEAEELFERPLHPYTRALISASLLTLPEEEGQEISQIILSGEMPSPLNPPPGCRFHTRCAEARERCSRVVPEARVIGKQRVKCHHYA